jgi:hypothetical protein
MPANGSAASHRSLSEKIISEEQALYSQFPEHKSLLQNVIDRSSEETKPVIVTEKPRRSSLSQEELLSILQKVREVSQLPGATLEKDTALYLEQQLADVLGFEVTSTLGNYQLPFIKATIASLSHLQMQPVKKASDTTSYVPEAESSKKRSYFGWDSSPFSASSMNDSNEDNLFWLAVPLFHFKHQLSSLNQLKSWWRKRKMVVINPVEAIAVVAEVKDDFYDTSNKYQLGGSPAVIREGLFWSPANLGKSLVFFISDQSEAVACGKYTLFK